MIEGMDFGVDLLCCGIDRRLIALLVDECGKADVSLRIAGRREVAEVLHDLYAEAHGRVDLHAYVIVVRRLAGSVRLHALQKFPVLHVVLVTERLHQLQTGQQALGDTVAGAVVAERVIVDRNHTVIDDLTVVFQIGAVAVVQILLGSGVAGKQVEIEILVGDLLVKPVDGSQSVKAICAGLVDDEDSLARLMVDDGFDGPFQPLRRRIGVEHQVGADQILHAGFGRAVESGQDVGGACPLLVQADDKVQACGLCLLIALDGDIALVLAVRPVRIDIDSGRRR